MGLPTRINIGPLFLFGVEGVVLQITFYLIALQGCIIFFTAVGRITHIVLTASGMLVPATNKRQTPQGVLLLHVFSQNDSNLYIMK